MNWKLVLLAILVAVAVSGAVAATDIVQLDGDDLSVTEEVERGTDPFDADTDGDGLDDSTELEVDTDPRDEDTDGDGLTDGAEMEVQGTDPTVADTDDDGLDDGAEVNTYGTNPTAHDTDGDGLGDVDEVERHGTDPATTDTDGDGLDDGAEIETHDTDPTDADTDSDDLVDGAEVNTHDTDPFGPDTDGDGLDDGAEVNDHGTDPLDDDTDGDGLIDGREVNEAHTDPGQADTDGDGLDDGAEIRTYDTSPIDADADDDGLDDGAEIDDHGTDPLEGDTDEDGLRDGQEVNDVGADPTDPDTDDDGLDDGIEANSDGPLADADPLRMDVFVELDYMAGEKPSEAGLDIVREAYAEAPIDNPDGTTGITLHIAIDDEIEYVSRTDTIRAAQLTTAHRDYDGFGYHHAIAVDDAWNSGSSVGGFAMPGRFVFQTDRNRNLGSDDPYPPRVLAKIFMHELGHSVGLAAWVYRGIDSREVPYSEYTSVMNYNSPPDAVRYNSGEPFDDWEYIALNLNTPGSNAAQPPELTGVMRPPGSGLLVEPTTREPERGLNQSAPGVHPTGLEDDAALGWALGCYWGEEPNPWRCRQATDTVG